MTLFTAAYIYKEASMFVNFSLKFTLFSALFVFALELMQRNMVLYLSLMIKHIQE